MNREMYQRSVGRFIYLAHTRLDIAYSVSVISQFIPDLQEPYLQATYRVFCYLKGTSGKGILFKRNYSIALEDCTDANYVGSFVNRRFTMEYCTFLGVNLVTWRSKKQNVVSRLSVELEFRAIAQGFL